VPGLVGRLTDALRAALNQAHADCTAGHESGQAALDASPAWQKLGPEQRYELRSRNGVRVLPAVEVGTPEEILGTLDRVKLSELRAISDALPTRFGNTLTGAAKLLEPKAQQLKLPGATIKNEADLLAWLDAVAGQIREKLKDGPVIV